MSSLPTPPDPIPQETPTPAPQPITPLQTPYVNPRRLPPPCWSHNETVALIDAYRDKWYALHRGNLKATHWQEVADAVGRRCPTATPAKTPVQCRHKMEKLRKRYRTEIQRSKSMPPSRFSSSWVHYERMYAMEKGRSVKADYNSDSGDDDDNEDEDEDEDDEDLNQDLYQYRPNFKNGLVSTRSIHNLYRNGINTGPGSGGSSGFRIRIPTGVSIAQSAPKLYAKVGTSPNPNFSPNFNQKPNFSGSGAGPGVNYGTRVLKGCVDSVMGGMGKREREPVVAEMVAAIKMLGDGFVKTEQMKMEMAREIETMRIDVEMKRTEMILDSQQRIVEAFAKAVSEKSKKPKRMPESES